jgi:hypothetical protein
MSRGPGKWQRAILDALETHEWIFLRDVLPPEHTPSQHRACRRAARQLRTQGRGSLDRLLRPWRLLPADGYTLGTMLVLRPGVIADYAQIYEQREGSR